MTDAKSHPAASAIVLFGLDGQGRPLAASFAADQTALALKAATSLKLQTLKIETAEQADLAQAVAGRRHPRRRPRDRALGQQGAV
jgi:hypothetical protein